MKERSPQPWTPEDDERLRKLAEEGRTSRIISERLKRTPDAIRRRARALKINLVKGMMGGVPWSSVEDQRLRNFALAGLSCAEIAIEMRRSASSVRSHAESLQIKIARGANALTSASMTGRLHPTWATSSPSERISASKYTVSANEIGPKEKGKS